MIIEKKIFKLGTGHAILLSKDEMMDLGCKAGMYVKADVTPIKPIVKITTIDKKVYVCYSVKLEVRGGMVGLMADCPEEDKSAFIDVRRIKSVEEIKS